MERITAQQYRACTGAKRSNKYGAKKVRTDEGVFDSQMEYERWCELKVLRDAGLIAGLTRQVTYKLEVNGVLIGKYTPDHRWYDRERDVIVVEDVKGVRTRDLGLRLRLMEALHGIKVQLWPERKRKKRRAKK